MENKKLNILLAEYINRNLGDTVIAECTKYFVEKALQNEGIQNYIIHDYNMYQEDMEYVKNADVVIFAGGGLIKYRREKFYQYVPDIIRIASENNIPVFINCTGVEGYDERDERCRRLKIAVNDACVKGITVRDDYQTFIKHYLETEKEWIGQVPDPAAFCSEVYGISGNPNTDKIGLGIARDGLFFDYGHQNITREFLLDFWKQVIFRLEELGYQWEIFNNGLHSDYEFGLDVLEYAGVENKKYFIRKRPAEGAELVRIISDYKGIIATRLHTNIIAYSMGCPSIGLVWNDKLAQWGAGIGHPERFVEADRMEALDVVSRLKRAMSEKHKKRGGGEDEILNFLGGFLKKYGFHTERQKQGEETKIGKKDWKRILTAAALGGKNSQFAGMNSPDTVLEKYNSGSRLFETDLKLTSDKKLVCVNGWTKNTLRKLGQPASEQQGFANGMKYEQFIGSSYYDGHYRTMDWDMLVSYITELEDAHFILDIRNSTNEQMIQIKNIINRDLMKNTFLRRRLILRIMKREEYDIIRDMGLEIMYDIPSKAEMMDLSINDQDIESMCRNEEISWISIRRSLCCPELVKKIKAYGKKTGLFSCNKVSEIKEWLLLGVDIIGTDYLDVCRLDDLLN